MKKFLLSAACFTLLFAFTVTMTPDGLSLTVRSAEAGKKVDVCHIPPGNPSNAHTIRVSQSAVAAHLAHGDTLGECSGVSSNENDNESNDNESKDNDNESKDNDNESKDNDNESKDNDNESKDNDNDNGSNGNDNEANENEDDENENGSASCVCPPGVNSCVCADGTPGAPGGASGPAASESQRSVHGGE